MYFEHTVIQNFKSIRNLEIDFKPGVNLLIGDNGAGKTSILEALTIALGGYLEGITGVSTRGIRQTDVRIERTPVADASVDLQYATPVDIESRVIADGDTYTWHRRRQDESGSSKTKTVGREIAKYAKEISGSGNMLPLLSYLSTSRVFLFKREDYGASLKKKLNDRRRGYLGCLDDTLDIKAIKHWCVEMELTAFQKNEPVREYEMFKNTVSVFMQKMNHLDDAPQVFYSRVFEDIVYAEGNTSVPIAYLSAGYQSLLWIAMNLAYRAVLLNPEMTDMTQLSGIVLVDELDMHLHPKWQWSALDALREVFPGIQFIVATHSSILISSCKDAHLIRISDDQEIEYLPSAYSYSVEDVLELRQTSTAVPVEIKELSDRFEAALNDDNYSLARTIYAEMLQKYGPDNSQVKSARFELDLEEDGE